MVRIVLAPQFTPHGHGGYVGWLEEFKMKVDGTTKESILVVMAHVIKKECPGLVDREDIPEEIRQLAAAILKYGFVLLDLQGLA